MSQFLVGQNIVDVVPDVFNGNNSTTGFTLTAATVTNAADVYISGVHQAPTTDYAITGGTTITFTTAPPTGTANILVVYAKAAIVNTPANASVDTIKIADNAVTLAKMAGGTDGNLISYDTNGDPAFVSTGTATHVLTSNGAGAAPTFQAAGGKIVQVVNFQTGAVATGTTVTPHDDTIPQNNEGDQFMSLAITPTNASNKLLISIEAGCSKSGGTPTITMALFQDSTVDALSAVGQFAVATAFENLVLTHYMTAGTTSATTFSVRIGGNTAGTTTFNGTNAARKNGGVNASSITIKEIAV